MKQQRPISTYRKRVMIQLLNFLFLTPFILSYRPLLLHYKFLDTLLYTLGFLLILVIIILSNRRPFIYLFDNKIIFHLHYYQSPEVHFFENIRLIEVLNKKSCKIYSKKYKPLKIKIKKKDMIDFIEKIDHKKIKITWLTK